jgi:spore germination protein PC
MSAQLADVQKQLDDIKSKPPLHIEYHFDQLKVNRLEGTLNVGISPQGISGIESLETPDPSCWKINSDPPDEAAVPIRNLQAEMSDYMKTNSNAVLLEMERQFGVSLDEEHRRRVVDDVAKQLNERVHYYARSSDYPAQGTEEERDKWKNAIIEKTRRDIRGAFSAYLSNQRQAMKGSDTAP